LRVCVKNSRERYGIVRRLRKMVGKVKLKMELMFMVFQKEKNHTTEYNVKEKMNILINNFLKRKSIKR